MPPEVLQILLIEDEPSDAALIQESLRTAERSSPVVRFEIIPATNLKSAITLLSNQSFDAILADLTLPDSRGLETVKELRQSAPDISLVVLSGINDEEMAIESVRGGAQDYLVKSNAAFQWLPRVIRYSIERKHTEEKLRDRETQLADLNRDLEKEVARRTEMLRHKEEELEQTRTLEAVGRLAGGVAHDFNNLLTGIVGIAQEVHDQLEPDNSLRADLEEAVKAGQRAFSLTKQLLTFGRRQISIPKVVDLNEVVADFQKLLARLIGEDVRLQTDFRPGIGNIRIDPGQVEQILVNLAVNARDAMPKGGELKIETGEHLEENGSEGPLSPGHYVSLTVRDTGTGMSPETLSHIFEPFFTTKGETGGTGLGLSTVYGIVKQAGGHIRVQSEEGSGTEIRIYFPRISASRPDDRRLDSRQTPYGGNETILVVEDEPIVRHVVVKMLLRAGYKVLEAEDGESALKLSANKEPIDMLLTDVVMPGMNGRELVAMMNQRYPRISVLYMSGYPKDIIDRKGLLKGKIHLIEKTAIPNYLLNTIREIFDKNAASDKTTAAKQ
jgi:signal transduction histidine kinase